MPTKIISPSTTTRPLRDNGTSALLLASVFDNSRPTMYQVATITTKYVNVANIPNCCSNLVSVDDERLTITMLFHKDINNLCAMVAGVDRKSTRLNSSHGY